ncbi:MAG: DUF3109 family protein [Bacteroidales bacterium]
MTMRNEVTFLQYGDFLVSSEIVTECFSCDFEKCLGACCIIGDSGAPLEEDECGLLERDYPKYSPFMTSEGCSAAECCGFFEIDGDGDIVTPLMRSANGPCAYSFEEDGKTFCAVERAYCKGLSQFRKPISCWLYPVRVTRLSSGLTRLDLHRWLICACAFEKGQKEKVPVYKYLREPLIAAFGQDLYDAIEASAPNFTPNDTPNAA